MSEGARALKAVGTRRRTARVAEAIFEESGLGGRRELETREVK